ncbi:MAG: QueT transporter family protein [Clostridia bacterium]|nr:QueT transporter family protein [Clostridia bacterium]
MFKVSTKKLVRAGVISALYVLLSLIVFPIASGVIQFRPSEALTLLPLFYVESVPALFIGCILSNFITGCNLIDVFFGSLVTLVASFITYSVGKLIKNKILKFFVAGIPPVVLNALLLPLIWYFCYGELQTIYILQAVFLLVSQSVSVYLIGVPLCLGVEKLIKRGYIGFID